MEEEDTQKQHFLDYQQKPRGIDRSLGLFFQNVSKGIKKLKGLNRRVRIFDIQNFIKKDMTPEEYIPYL